MTFIRFPKKDYKKSRIIVKISIKTNPKVNFQKIFAFLNSIKSNATKINLAAQSIKSKKYTVVLPFVVFIVTILEISVSASKAIKVYSFDSFMI